MDGFIILNSNSDDRNKIVSASMDDVDCVKFNFAGDNVIIERLKECYDGTSPCNC